MPIPGVWIETLKPPSDYDPQQIEYAVHIASVLNRGRLVLLVEPEER